jgi:hypothetical protein
MQSYNEKQQLAAPLTGYDDAESGRIKAQQTSSGHQSNQKSGVRDPIFLLLFVGHLIAMFYGELRRGAKQSGMEWSGVERREENRREEKRREEKRREDKRSGELRTPARGGVKRASASFNHKTLVAISSPISPAFNASLTHHRSASLVLVAFTSGIDAVKTWNDDADTDTDTSVTVNKKLMYTTVGICVASSAFTGVLVSFLMRNAESLIQTSLRMSIAISLLCTLLCFSQGGPLVYMGVIFAIMTLINWCYYRAVQSRIPFAAANLKVACQAVRDHFSVLLISYFTIVKSTIYFSVWVLVFAAAYKAGVTTTTDEYGNTVTVTSDNFGTIMFFVLLSLYWTQEVLKNITHVTTAGVVASWWYDPSRSSVVSGAYCRATTTSLGSIAMGSFFVAVLKVLEDMARNARREVRRGEARRARWKRVVAKYIQVIAKYITGCRFAPIITP